MFHLPNEIQEIIYSFDSTYRLSFQKVLKQIIHFNTYHKQICNSGVYNVFDKICRNCMKQQNINRQLKPFKDILRDSNNY